MQFIDLQYQQKIIKEDLEKRISNVLTHGQYIQGPEVIELESLLANYVGAKYCISVANGTDALQISLMAIGIEKGDEVIMPAFSFAATVEPALLLGAIPIFVDINAETLTIELDEIEKSISERTKAIIPVSIFGQCPDFTKINDIAEKHNIVVIEDAAQSFGSTYNGKKSCNLSTIACTSFFPSKPLGCYGDGGAIFCSNDELANAIRLIARHGQDGKYNHIRLGVNSRLDTIQAAILLSKLTIFEEEVKLRIDIANIYKENIKFTPNLRFQKAIPNTTSVFAQFTLLTDVRDKLAEELASQGIPFAIHYPLPLNEQPAFKKYKTNTPISHKTCNDAISIPMGPYLQPGNQYSIVDIVNNHFHY